MFLILEAEYFPQSSLDELLLHGNIYFSFNDAINEAKEIQVIFTRLGSYIDKEFISHFPNLKILATPTTGLNHVDSEVLSQVHVVSLQGEREFLDQIPATAEFAFLSVLMSLKKIKGILASKNTYRNRDLFLSNDLKGKNVLLLGLGRIGKMLAEFLNAFGAKVYYIDENVCIEEYKKLSWDDDFDHIDILSIHLSYRDANKGLLNLNFLRKFRNLRVFVNTARGELLDEHDLLRYMSEMQDCEFVIDVINDEQKGLSSPLYECALPNVLLTPHVAGNSIDSRQEVERFITSKVIAVIEREKNVRK